MKHYIQRIFLFLMLLSGLTFNLHKGHLIVSATVLYACDPDDEDWGGGDGGGDSSGDCGDDDSDNDDSDNDIPYNNCYDYDNDEDETADNNSYNSNTEDTDRNLGDTPFFDSNIDLPTSGDTEEFHYYICNQDNPYVSRGLIDEGSYAVEYETSDGGCETVYLTTEQFAILYFQGTQSYIEFMNLRDGQTKVPNGNWEVFY
jgi:hypothetical protein